jgi:hypothetical protein
LIEPEFAAFIKGWEYIIAIASVLVFVGFWRLLNYQRHADEPGVGGGTDYLPR